ncbi:nickel-dependent lactate racemase [Marinicrinis sediminis]|uniref:Nickel-dependent lactate racemase n=1 Tax=Marinicrinis sediminis TaxID=1652465 RepID=A0ABW5R8U8_9BACL
MSIMKLPYGNQSVQLSLPSGMKSTPIVYEGAAFYDGTDPAAIYAAEQEILLAAMHKPVGTPPLHDMYRAGQQVVILVSDGTRLAPSCRFLPLLIASLETRGMHASDLTIVVALGSHRRHTQGELQALVGRAVYEKYEVVNHSSRWEDCKLLGWTSRGTPVALNSRVVEADLVIATGGIEPHRMAGMSGGIKALFPGCAAAASITHNHHLGMEATEKPGDIRNPVHADMLEVLRFQPVHFLLNVIVDHERRILAAVAGDCMQAHAYGCQLVKKLFFTKVETQHDLVLVSAGGSPKDVHLYQALKAFQNAADFTRPGGSIVCVAECPEHYGNGHFQQLIQSSATVADMDQRVRTMYQLGAHKAITLHKLVQRFALYLYSAMPPSLVEACEIIPIVQLADLEALIHDMWASRYLDPTFSSAWMPFGSITYSSGLT